MENLVFFVERIALGLYLLTGLGLLLGLRNFYVARQGLAAAQFELERELASYRVANATVIVFGLIELALAVVALSQVVAPTLRVQPPRGMPITDAVVGEAPFVTAAPGSLLNATQGPQFAQGVELPGLEDELNLQPFATPTLTPTPVGTIIPDVPAPVGCDTPNAQLVIPANGMVVFEATTVVGTANTTDFAFYRFELKGPQTNNEWRMLSEYSVPIDNGELGQIVPSMLIPGEYRFRLNVFDINSALRESCTVTMIVSPPIPTPTPIR